MEKRTNPQRKSYERPSLARAGMIFGAAMVASLGLGILLQSHDPGPEREPEMTRTDKRTEARRAERAARVEAERASATLAVASAGSEVAIPAAIVADEPAPSDETIAEPSEPVTFAEAEAAYFDGDWEKSAELFASFVEGSPGNPWGHYMSGLAARKAGRYEDSEKALERTLEILPEHVKSLVNLARTRLDAGRPEDALFPAERAVEIDSANGDAYRVLGRVLHTLERRAEALEAYASALNLNDSDVWSLNNSGLILIEENRFEEARTALARACELDSSVAYFQNNFGVALERTGNLEAAADAFARAVAIDPGHEKAIASLARVEPLLPARVLVKEDARSEEHVASGPSPAEQPESVPTTAEPPADSTSEEPVDLAVTDGSIEDDVK